MNATVWTKTVAPPKFTNTPARYSLARKTFGQMRQGHVAPACRKAPATPPGDWGGHDALTPTPGNAPSPRLLGIPAGLAPTGARPAAAALPPSAPPPGLRTPRIGLPGTPGLPTSPPPPPGLLTLRIGLSAPPSRGIPIVGIRLGHVVPGLPRSAALGLLVLLASLSVVPPLARRYDGVHAGPQTPVTSPDRPPPASGVPLGVPRPTAAAVDRVGDSGPPASAV